MSGLKTFLVALIMAQSVSAGVADPARTFAQCAGRMSAELEFAWLIGRPSDEIETFRAHMIELVDAVMEPDTGPQVLAIRIEAKHAHASLLTRAHFSQSPAEGQRAARLAANYRSQCKALLVS